jgi:hypothetical protein
MRYYRAGRRWFQVGGSAEKVGGIRGDSWRCWCRKAAGIAAKAVLIKRKSKKTL